MTAGGGEITASKSDPEWEPEREPVCEPVCEPVTKPIHQVTQLPSDVTSSNWNPAAGCSHGADRIPASHRTKIPLCGEDRPGKHGAHTHSGLTFFFQEKRRVAAQRCAQLVPEWKPSPQPGSCFSAGCCVFSCFPAAAAVVVGGKLEL